MELTHHDIKDSMLICLGLGASDPWRVIMLSTRYITVQSPSTGKIYMLKNDASLTAETYEGGKTVKLEDLAQ